MNIPTYRVVDVVELAKELGNYHVEADYNGNNDLVDEVYYYLTSTDEPYLEDHIRFPADDDWEEIPEPIKQAYDYLVTMYGFQRGDCFLWYFPDVSF